MTKLEFIKSIINKKFSFNNYINDENFSSSTTPVFIDENNSLFQIDDIMNSKNNIYNQVAKKINFSSLIPGITLEDNHLFRENILFLDQLLNSNSNILVIGSSVNERPELIYLNKSHYNIIKSDIVLHDNVDVIFDAHNIPFKNQVFDAVIIQAVLEHVINPQAVVKEIHRILKPNGLVYAETPFMQQIHAMQFDFTRYSYLGHLKLFSMFDDLKSGPIGGPGTVLSWSIAYFFRSFASSSIMRKILWAIGCYVAFPFKYFDLILKKKKGFYDSSSANYFLGRKRNLPIEDKNLIKKFKGIDF